MKNIVTFILLLTASLTYGQIIILKESQHLAVIYKGQKIFLERDDYMKDIIFEITDKIDTVVVLEADKTFFKFKRDTLAAWALTNQISEYGGIITKPTLYEIKMPFKHIMHSSTYAYDQGKKMSNKILDLKKGESIIVTKRENDFFQITYKDKTAYVFENDIIPVETQHPIKKALYESSYTSPTPTKTQPTKAKSTGRTYYSGTRGGCYYINSSGKKVYVDHSYCN